MPEFQGERAKCVDGEKWLRNLTQTMTIIGRSRECSNKDLKFGWVFAGLIEDRVFLGDKGEIEYFDAPTRMWKVRTQDALCDYLEEPACIYKRRFHITDDDGDLEDTLPDPLCNGCFMKRIVEYVANKLIPHPVELDDPDAGRFKMLFAGTMW